MIVADDELDAVQAALIEALEEGAPVDLGFAEGDADAQEGAFAVGIDAHSPGGPRCVGKAGLGGLGNVRPAWPR
jgi:hypothetical protein